MAARLESEMSHTERDQNGRRCRFRGYQKQRTSELCTIKKSSTAQQPDIPARSLRDREAKAIRLGSGIYYQFCTEIIVCVLCMRQRAVIPLDLASNITLGMGVQPNPLS